MSGAIANNPTNPNFLSPINFRLQIKRSPNVNFFVQQVNIPGLALPPVHSPTPIIQIPYPGDHLSYEELTVTFRVDEDLNNYLEIHSWIRALGKLNVAEYSKLAQSSNFSGVSIRSDISLLILNSNKQPNIEVAFNEAFPVSLSSLNFDTTLTDVEYLSAVATFQYINYEITKSS